MRVTAWCVRAFVASCLSMGVSSSALAASIAIQGTDGIPGANGAAGQPGMAGGPGGDALADANSPDLTNTASATGGAGGPGGNGGNASPPSGTPGAGGPGGAGGGATASATVSSSQPFARVSATATATGGTGGAGGTGGSSSHGIAASGNGGSGGAAIAHASTTSVGGPSPFAVGGAAGVATATGGAGANGGARGGDGGAATASADVTVDGSADAGETLTATGGNGGSGEIGGNGGVAQIAPSSLAVTSGNRDLRAYAFGGNGGGSTGTDSMARNGNGADAVLDDVFTTSGSFAFAVTQEAHGGNAGNGGGAAGHAGDATSRFTGSVDGVTAVLTAVGGNGSPGRGGADSSAGDASVIADVTSDSQDVFITSTATGGTSLGGGDGGNATQDLVVHSRRESTGIGSVARGGSVDGICTALTPCNGGNAVTHSTVQTLGNTVINISDRSTGGNGGRADLGTNADGGRGGDATSDVEAITAGGYGASASAYAEAGDGGDGSGSGIGGAAGIADAHAHAHSDEGPAFAGVTVVAGRAGSGADAPARGADVVLVNRPAAESTGSVSLLQGAVAGSSPDGPGSRGGDARSVLTLDRDGVRDITLQASAVGGSAGIGTAADPGRGGDATVVVEGTGHGFANVTVTGYVAGGSAVGGGQIGLATLESVVGRSDHGAVSVTGKVAGASGSNGSVDLDGVVTGSTTGSLSLDQEATAGFGTGNHASSRLHQSASVESLSLSTYAQGSYGLADSLAINDAGPASAKAEGRSLTGDGTAQAQAETFGDGHEVSASSIANGDGNANSSATGIAHGQAVSNVSAIAGTGIYGLGIPAENATANAVGAAGGLGAARVRASAQAGLAQAVATGTSSYQVDVASDATGHGGSFASATTQSAGVLPTILARADADSGSLGEQLLARVGVRNPFSYDYGLGSSGPKVAVEAMPFFSTGAALAGNPNVIGSLDATEKVVALASVTSGYQSGGGFGDSWTGKVSFGVDRSELLAPDLTLGFLDPTMPSQGFDSLAIHISLDGAPVADFVFTDPSAAMAALDDQLVHIDLPLTGSSQVATLVVQYIARGVRVSNNDPLFSDFALIAHALPEPAAWLVLAVGALILAAHRLTRISFALALSARHARPLAVTESSLPAAPLLRLSYGSLILRWTVSGWREP